MGFSQLESRLLGMEPLVIAVAGAGGDEVFEALKAAEEKGLARFILTGKREMCEDMSARYGINPVEIIASGSDEEAVAQSISLVCSGAAGLLMKGKVPTPTLLKGVVSEKSLFEEGALLSHILVVERPDGRLLGITDGGMNLYPDLEQKEKIIRSAVHLFHHLGVDTPKVAVLAANEKVNPKMIESVHAAELAERFRRQENPGCVVDGPVALDIAVDPHAAELKGYEGAVRGDADILIVHDISSGNYLGKSMIYLAGYSGGGMILGAKVPIILLSRSDSAREKYQSILLSLCCGGGVR
jgi:phosphate butyryltransferase